MPQTLEDLKQQFGGRWYDFGAKEQRLGAQSPGAGWMRAPRIDPMAEAVWHPQYGWQRWRDVKGGDYGGLTAQFGDPYEIFGYKQSGEKAHGLYRPGPGGGAPPGIERHEAGPGGDVRPNGLPPGIGQNIMGPGGDVRPGGLPPGIERHEAGPGVSMGMQMAGLQPSRFNYGGGYGVQGRQPYRYPGGGF